MSIKAGNTVFFLRIHLKCNSHDVPVITGPVSDLIMRHAYVTDLKIINLGGKVWSGKILLRL
jgi:hypothetical protein